MPALPPEAGGWHQFGWGRGDAPAGHGGGRQVDQILLGQCPPAPDDESGDARRLRRQLQAPRGDEAHARDLADDGRQSLLAQPLLDERQDLPLAFGFGVDHPVRVQASPKEARREQVPACQAPEHGTLESGGNPCREERRAAGELRGKTGLDHLVQRASREAASRQMIIDGVKTKRERLGLMYSAFQPGNPEPQSGKPVLLPGLHDPVPVQVRVEDVPIMFSYVGESIDRIRAVNVGENNVS